MAWKWYDSKVIEIKEMSPTVRQFFLKVDEIESFDFEAGQFITLDLPISDKRLKRWRSYSIANRPDGGSVIELCIVHLEDGKGSGYMFNDVEVGSEIRFKGPSGAFYLPESVPSHMVMVCTGTGVAPFRSMIFDLIHKDKNFHHIHLIFGARNEEDILYREEFEELADQHSEITYDVCLSRDEDWKGFKGYVHQVYLQGNYPEGTKYYLCGWSEMIDDAVENLLLKKQIDKKDIIYELYG